MAKRTEPALPSGSDPLLSRAAEFQDALQSWFAANQRPLPWRKERSLYRTVVSEMMLQQTRIETALPYFDRWMRALPDFEALAAAPEEQVLKLWEGLGYYRRARNLQRLAQQFIALSEQPRSAADWQALPGIGPYSAAAITSLAFGTPAACVDGNVVRVLARLVGHGRPLKGSSQAARLFQPLADALLDRRRPGAHNEALMELGATFCQRAPDCPNCPVAAFCVGRKNGNAAAIPLFPPRAMEKQEVLRIWCERGGKLLVSRTDGSARRLADLCELPRPEDLGWSSRQLRSRGRLQLKKTRSITRYSITESIYDIGGKAPARLPDHLFWAPRQTLATLTFSGPHRRWITEILAAGAD